MAVTTTGVAQPTANGLPGARPAGPRVPAFGVRPPGPPSMGPPGQAPLGRLPQSPAASQVPSTGFPPQQQMLGRPGLVPPGRQESWQCQTGSPCKFSNADA